MYRFLLLALALLLSVSSRSQTVTFPGNWSMGMHYHYGFTVAHRPSIIHLQQEHLRGFEINWQKLPASSDSWRSLYNFPWLGFTYLNFDLGNPLELGQGHGFFPEIYFPLIAKRPLQLVVRTGLGIGYVERPFNAEDNYKNLAIGSKINCGINTALLFRIPASKRFQITTGLNFTHYSNGASKMPNLGLNMATVQAGIQYIAGKEQVREKLPDPERRKGIEYSATLAAAFKDIYPPGGKTYYPVTFNLNAMGDISPKSLVGGGFDFTIDPSIVPRLEEDQREGFGKKSRIGIHAGYGLRVGRCSGTLQTGTYLYNHLRIDGTIYNRLLFRYYATDALYFCFNLKSHFAKADYFEWGIGYAIRK